MDAFFQLDGNILLWIQQYIRNDFLTPIFKFITSLGDEGFVWIAIAVLLLFIILHYAFFKGNSALFVIMHPLEVQPVQIHPFPQKPPAL